MNLEEVVEKQFGEIKKENEKISKLKSKVKQIETQIDRALKQRSEKEQLIEKFIADVHKIVSTKDDKAYC